MNKTVPVPQSDTLETHSKEKRLRPRIALSTLLLSVSAIAVWLANWQASQSIKSLENQLPGLRDAARELQVDDPTQLAVVSRIGQWFGETIFDVFIPDCIPDHRRYRLNVSLDKIGARGLAVPLQQADLTPGRHSIEIRYDKSEKEKSAIQVLIDDLTAIEITRPGDWEPRSGSSGGKLIGESRQHPIDEPLVLFRRRFMVKAKSGNSSHTPAEPAAGILVWIDSIVEQ